MRTHAHARMPRGSRRFQSRSCAWLLVRAVYENHQGHHVLGGQCNYNVCCPGTDHLLGTRTPTAIWSKRMRSVPGPVRELARSRCDERAPLPACR